MFEVERSKINITESLTALPEV